jgi:hypothetical protein
VTFGEDAEVGFGKWGKDVVRMEETAGKDVVRRDDFAGMAFDG